jgi:hypothetical protein
MIVPVAVNQCPLPATNTAKNYLPTMILMHANEKRPAEAGRSFYPANSATI